MRVLVTGASGLIGSAVVAQLKLDGHELLTLGRSHSKNRGALTWNVGDRAGSLDDAGPIDAVIHLAGESIGDKRWTATRKTKIVDSRIASTSFLIDLLDRADIRPNVFISASAIGVYGDRGSETLDESSLPGNGFLASLTLDWEHEAERAKTVAKRVCCIRSGVVLSNYGGALGKQLPLFKFGLGAVFGDGCQYLSWIHLEDEVNAISLALTNDSISGPVNLVSPNPVTNQIFSKTLAKVLRKPLFLKIPAFVLELALGKEFADEMLLASQRVYPNELTKAGFKFRFPELDNALSDLLR